MKSTNKITIQRSSLNAEEELSDGCILYWENSVLVFFCFNSHSIFLFCLTILNYLIKIKKVNKFHLENKKG